MIENIPDGWRVKKLRDIVKIRKGKKVDIFEEYENGLFNYIDISVLRTKKYKYTNNNQIMATEKDILLVWDGANAGYSSFGLTGAVGSTLAKLSLKDENIFSSYFGKFILSKFKYLSDTSYGATIPHIQRQMLENINIPIPPLPQQEKIVKVLDISSALIEKQKLLLQKYDLFLKSKFIEMFGDPIQNPMGWEVKKLKEISSLISSGNTPKGGSQVYVKEGILFFRSQNVWKNKMLLDDIAYIDNETHLKMKKSSLKHKDILMTKTGRFNTENSSLGRAALFLGEDDSANVNGHVYLIRLKKQTIPEFVVYILTTDEYRDYIRRVCVGGIDKRQINKSHLENFPIVFPPIDLQNEFASIVERINTIKTKEAQKLEHLETLHKSLMDKAFKGEI
jgi:restriction endonuclease S subunit